MSATRPIGPEFVPVQPKAGTDDAADAAAPQPAVATTGTALAVVAPAPSDAGVLPPPQRNSAPFLAHLIATRHGHPQTRERRRAAPQEAAAAYEDVLERIHRFP
jgi:hypothetical protein